MVAGTVRSLLGLVVLCLGALLAHSLSLLLGVNELLLAIGIGVALANTVGVPDQIRAGVQTHKIWLAAGIVLLGASLSVDAVLETGTTALFLMLWIVTVTLLSVELMARNVAG